MARLGTCSSFIWFGEVLVLKFSHYLKRFKGCIKFSCVAAMIIIKKWVCIWTASSSLQRLGMFPSFCIVRIYDGTILIFQMTFMLKWHSCCVSSETEASKTFKHACVFVSCTFCEATSVNKYFSFL